MMMMHLFITVDSGGEITCKAEQQRATLYKRRQKTVLTDRPKAQPKITQDLVRVY